MVFFIIKIIFTSFFLIQPTIQGKSYLESVNPDSLRHKTATAVRIFEEPIIDGKLDDDVWSSA